MKPLRRDTGKSINLMMEEVHEAFAERYLYVDIFRLRGIQVYVEGIGASIEVIVDTIEFYTT